MLSREKFKVQDSKLHGVRSLPSGGFTIIEVMASMDIFSVSILGLAASVNCSIATLISGLSFL